MDASKDYYAILGVLPSIEPTALKAVYLARLKIYHPDVFQGDKAEAERITKELNEAYSVLGDPQSRKEYDEARIGGSGNRGNFEQENNYGDSFYDKDLEDKWNLITEYFPDIISYHLQLEKFSKKLAFTFKVILIAEKLGSHAEKLSELMRIDFLNRYFGNNVAIHNFVVEMVDLGRKDVLLELNRLIGILGSPTEANADDLINKIYDKFFLGSKRVINIDLVTTKISKLYHLETHRNTLFYAAQLKNGEFICYLKRTIDSRKSGYFIFENFKIFLKIYALYFRDFQEVKSSNLEMELSSFKFQIKQLGVHQYFPT
jgi:DnaJ domain